MKKFLIPLLLFIAGIEAGDKDTLASQSLLLQKESALPLQLNNFHQEQPSLPPFVLGGKTFNPRNLTSNQTEILLKVAYPSMIERWYGINSETVTPETIKKIDNMSQKITHGMKLNVLPIQGSYIMSNEPDCKNYHVTKAAFCSGILCIIGTSITGWWGMCTNVPIDLCCKAMWLKGFLPSLGVIPAATASAECVNCLYHRCCAEREIWISNKDEIGG